MEFYLREATTSARRIKELNPGTNITIVTNPGVSPAITTVFDMVRQASIPSIFVFFYFSVAWQFWCGDAPSEAEYQYSTNGSFGDVGVMLVWWLQRGRKGGKDTRCSFLYREKNNGRSVGQAWFTSYFVDRPARACVHVGCAWFNSSRFCRVTP